MLNIPQHIAIIMDGNGRWAESRGLMRFEGHIAGIETVKTVIKSCLDTQIPVLSLFAFSSENWLRPPKEVHFLMQLFLETLQKEVQELNKRQICLHFTGDRQGLLPAIQEQMHYAEELTAGNQALTLNLALNYGGRWEIVRAARCIAEDVRAGNVEIDSINEQSFGQYLATRALPDPDLFIRTSGESRISNFFLWQLAYTELYFTPTLWPDFTKEEFEKALVSFQERERRYGQTSQQINELNNV
ncbi:MAG: di-trans,poly-cis-decaprenylcistransferase [Legionellales bacterium RIFCSPHIGHO2_12_FULL_42_9]|nr:MAG: di-trans,poly-cis-decaprenylcistransferase [Legionellales bacterium RIFCSPHIGHO2_12_FULL_42_9]